MWQPSRSSRSHWDGSSAPVFEWRIRPHVLSESKERGLQPPSQSQSLVGFLERFGQLSVGSIAQLPPNGQPGWVSTQPTFTFPDHGGTTIQSGASASFHSAQRRLHQNLSHRGWSIGMKAPTGTGVSQQQGPLGQSSPEWRRETLLLPRLTPPPRQPPARLPPVNQIPSGWAFYPREGWVQYQWMQACPHSTAGTTNCHSPMAQSDF